MSEETIGEANAVDDQQPISTEVDDVDDVTDEELVAALRAKRERRLARQREAEAKQEELREKSEQLKRQVAEQAEAAKRAEEEEDAARRERAQRREAQRKAREAAELEEEQRLEKERANRKEERERKRQQRLQKKREEMLQAAAERKVEEPQAQESQAAESVAEDSPSVEAQKSKPLPTSQTAPPSNSETTAEKETVVLDSADVVAAADASLSDSKNINAENLRKAAAAIAADTSLTTLMAEVASDSSGAAPTHVSSELRHAALGNSREDQALRRASKRSEDRMRKKMRRLNNPNTSEEEKNRLRADLEKERAKQFDLIKLSRGQDAAEDAIIEKFDKMMLAKTTSARQDNSMSLADRLEAIDQEAERETLLNEMRQAIAEEESSAAEATAREGKLRVGVIGAGKNTKTKHIPLLQQLEGVEITHVCNRTLTSSMQAAKEFNIPNAASSVDAILDNRDIDAVVIGTWPFVHNEYATKALRNGKHVLCEARMAMNASEARRMHATARANPRLVAQIVPSPMTLKFDATIKDYVETKLGDLLMVRATAIGNDFVPQPDASYSVPWRCDRKLSGNNIMMMGILYEALMRWVGTASTVAATGSATVEAHGDMPNILSIQGKLKKNKAVYQMTLSDSCGLGKSLEFWLFGSEGTLHLDIANGGILRFGARNDKVLSDITDLTKDARGWNVESDFVASIRNKTPVQLTDFATGVLYMEFTDGVWTAMETESEIELK